VKSIVRLGAALAMAAALVTGIASSASAEWSSHIEVHVRACPSDVADWFADCHDNPVPDFAITTDGFDEDNCVTDADGNCAWDDSSSWYYIDWTPEVVYQYCSADSDIVTIDHTGEVGAEGFVQLDLDEGVVNIVCDFYIIDDSLVADDSAALPDTGAGMGGQSANLGLLLAGVVALGGLAVASRRAAVR